MSKVLSVKLSKDQERIAFKIYKSLPVNSLIHNLSDVAVIPFYVKFTLGLGLNFCPTKKPSKNFLLYKMQENVRRLCWNLHFKLQGSSSSMNDMDRFIYNCKKQMDRSHLCSKLQEQLFPNPNVLEKLLIKIRSKCNIEIFPPTELISKTKSFMQAHDLVCSNADKNAGICIIKQDWYDKEIYRHLHDENSYNLSCKAQFDRDVLDWIDKIKFLKLKIKPNVTLDSFIINRCEPSKFYILPKVHKVYECFPPGRPISSNCNTVNRNLSAYIDFILKPIMCTLPNLVLDTTHFLVLLNACKLDPNKNYCLITFDIDSMYTSLKLSHCKKILH